MTQREKDDLLNVLLAEFRKDDLGAMDMLARPERRAEEGRARAERYARFEAVGRALRAAGGAALMNDMVRNVRRADGGWAGRLEAAWKPLGYAPVPRLP